MIGAILLSATLMGAGNGAHVTVNPAPVAGAIVHLTPGDLPSWCAGGILTIFTGDGFSGATCDRTHRP